MDLLKIEKYKSDVKRSINSVVNLENLKEVSILVTGSTGLICSAIIDELLILNIENNYNIKIYACSRGEDRLIERFEERLDNINLIYVEYDARKELKFDFKVDYIIHGASNASPELYIKYPVETMLSNFLGMRNLLEYAKRSSVKSVIYISSSEVYGKKENNNPYKENEYGYIDILDVRSSYSNSKRATETLCKSYSEQYGLDIKIVRPGHIYGPSAKKNDKRISSAFMYDALEGKNLVMKSKGEQIRSYCHSLDCASAILTVLLNGVSGESYNISNKDSIITIRQMAEIISKVAGVELLFDIPNAMEMKQQNPMNNSSLNSGKLANLGWNGVFSAEEGFKVTYDVLNFRQRGLL